MTIDTLEGKVKAPTPGQVSPTLEPIPLPRAGGGPPIERGFDAEFKLFGHTLLRTSENSVGQLYLGVSAPMCPSCFVNLQNIRAVVPGVKFITTMPTHSQGAAGALSPSLLSDTPSDRAPSSPVLEIRINYD